MVRFLLTALCAGLVAGVPLAPQNYQMRMKTLILSTNPLMSILPNWMANAYGQDHDLIELVDGNTLTDPDGKFLDKLVDGQGNPQYNSLVLHTPRLAYDIGNGTFPSALTNDQWERLNGWAAAYKIRTVVLASSYVVDPGLQAAPGWEKGTDMDAFITFIDNELTEQIRGNIRKESRFRTGQVNEFVRTSYYFYPTFVKEGNPHIKPFLAMNPVNPLPNPACNINTDTANQTVVPIIGDPRGIVLTNCYPATLPDPNWVGAFIRTTPDGREEMHFMINSNTFGHHGFALADVWLPWAMRGMWLGQRRMYLNTHIDDVFLSTAVYNITLNRPAIEDEWAYRVTATDFVHLVNYTKEFNKRSSPGTRYTIELAFNGIGWFANGLEKDFPDQVNMKALELRDHFFWVSHTWGHLDLYCPNSDCNRYGFTKYNDSLWDLKKNEWFAENVLFADIPSDKIENWPTFSRHGLVTPRISGQNLSDSIQAMNDVGIDNTVGDNSRPLLRPLNPFHGLWTPTKDNQGRSAFIIPRWATRIYFDVSTEVEAAKEHNSIYGPNCYGYDRVGEASFPYKCNTTTFKYPRDLTLDEIMMIESFETARNFLGYRTDPYMFHQANLRFFEKDGKKTSLLTEWVDAVMEQVTQYNTLPLISHKMDDLKKILLERMDRDACGLVGTIEYNAGVPVSMHISSNSSCVAKVSRTTGTTLQFVDGVEEEAYGPDRTRDVPLNGSTVTLTFGVPPGGSAPVKPFLPYPPVDHVVNITFGGILNLNKFEMDVIQNVTALEKSLKDQVQASMQKVDDAIGAVTSLTCRSIENNQYIQEIYDLIDEVSKPAIKARADNTTGSWYRIMEDSLAKLANDFAVYAQGIQNDDPNKGKGIAAEHSKNSIDRLENYASAYMKRRWSQWQDAVAKYNKKGGCSGAEAPAQIKIDTSTAHMGDTTEEDLSIPGSLGGSPTSDM